MDDQIISDMREDTSMGRYTATASDIPTSWTPDHLAQRIRDHFTYWDRTPDFRGPRQFGANWPGYQHTWQDVSGYRNRDGEPEEIQRLGNPWEEHMQHMHCMRVALNGYEVMIRDSVQSYLVAFRQASPKPCELIVFDARESVNGKKVRERAQEWGMAKSSYDDARKRALNACCVFLNRLGRRVF
ncbi:MAG: hypothetical protein Q8M31_21730 [Beijerinckiaceae bacterium]|nr:hypothetical protein [Beijerinckiaceae bacterium]